MIKASAPNDSPPPFFEQREKLESADSSDEVDLNSSQIRLVRVGILIDCVEPDSKVSRTRSRARFDLVNPSPNESDLFLATFRQLRARSDRCQPDCLFP